MKRYNHLNSYLKAKFGGRTLKICVDAGTTCPNRDGLKSQRGCLFCSTFGSGDHLTRGLSISEQIRRYMNSYKSDRAERFIVYFQSYSNTYGNREELKKKYLEAINFSDKIVALQIATRPDCIDEEIVQILSFLNKIKPIIIELGLQTASDEIGKNLNLHYTSLDFIYAVKLLNSAGIEVVAHIMVGLPKETHQDVIKTVDFLNSLPISGIKIHSTYITKDSGLYDLYKEGAYTPISLDAYLNELAYIISNLKSNIVIHRISGDPPRETFIAPDWALHKKLVLNGLDKILFINDIIQGDKKLK